MLILAWEVMGAAEVKREWLALENSLVVSPNLNTVAIGASNSTPRHIPKTTENIRPHKKSHINVHSSIIHNSQKVETTQLSIS